jgi:oligopeptide transport system substrate-binding protein
MTELGTTRDQIPPIEYLTDDRPDRKLIAEALQDILDKSLGLKLDIKLVQTKQRYQLMDEKNFDIVFAGFGPDYDDPMTYLDRLMSTSGLNDTGFASERFDELITFAKTTLDTEARAEAMFEAEQILMEEGPLVPVYYRSTAWTKADNLVNITRSGMRADPDYTFADFTE